MRKNYSLWLPVFLALTLPGAMTTPALADVTDVSPGGFTVRLEIDIEASPIDVYEAAVGRIAEWWSSDHTFSGDAANMTIEHRLGGCFCETFGHVSEPRQDDSSDRGPGPAGTDGRQRQHDLGVRRS